MWVIETRECPINTLSQSDNPIQPGGGADCPGKPNCEKEHPSVTALTGYIIQKAWYSEFLVLFSFYCRAAALKTIQN